MFLCKNSINCKTTLNLSYIQWYALSVGLNKSHLEHFDDIGPIKASIYQKEDHHSVCDEDPNKPKAFALIRLSC